MILFQKAEFALDPSRGEGFVAGFASKYDGIDSYGDTIVKGAYADVVSTGPLPKMFFNHNTRGVPQGDWTKWEDREDGLYMEGYLDLAVSGSQDIYHSIRAGRIDGLSVSIKAAWDDVEFVDDDEYLFGRRIIKKVSEVREVSLCTFPADKQARLTEYKCEGVQRDDIACIATIRDMEKCLRDAGFPKRQAEQMIAVARQAALREIRADAQRDADQQKICQLSMQLTDILQRIKHG